MQTSLPFALPALFAVIAIAGSVAALTLRNLVHCALALVIAFAGLGGLYVVLGAQFAGLAQVLVYSGAVAILIVFATLLVREGEEDAGQPVHWSVIAAGLTVAGLVFIVIARAILSSTSLHNAAPSAPVAGIREIGAVMMRDDVLPLEIIGLLLTAAMLGAVIVALRERVAKP